MLLRIVTRSFFFFNDTASTEFYTLSLHDALPILNRSAENSSTEIATMIRGRAIDCASAAVETATTMTGNSTLNFMCALSLHSTLGWMIVYPRYNRLLLQSSLHGCASHIDFKFTRLDRALALSRRSLYRSTR